MNSSSLDFKKRLLALAIPLILQSLLSALVGASDALMLGRLSEEAVAAVSLANEVSFIMSLFVSAVTSSSTILIAQYKGKGDRETSRQIMAYSLRWSFLISLLFFCCSFFFPEWILRLLTNQEELIPIGASYLKIVSFSFLFQGINAEYLAVMKVEDRAQKSVWISVCTVTVDMLVDFFLIYGKAGVPKLGADGSAYSTIVVELLACVICMVDAFKGNHLHPTWNHFVKFTPTLEWDSIKIGSPLLWSGLSWGISMSIHSMMLAHMSVDATAASSIATVALHLVECISLGVTGAAGIMVGEKLGANDIETAKEYGSRFWRVTFICGLINMAALVLIAPPIYFFFKLEKQARIYLVEMLAYNVLYMFAFSYNNIIVCGVLPAGGDTKYDAYTILFATWLFALPLSLLGCFVFHWPVMVVYMVMLCDEIVKAPFAILRYRKYYWLNNLTRES